MLLQRRQEHDIRELNKAVNEFRQSHQQPDGRREFDLNDPDALKKDKPARVSDDDPRCGVSSLQKFVGEDLNGKARSKLQQEQARWVLICCVLFFKQGNFLFSSVWFIWDLSGFIANSLSRHTMLLPTNMAAENQTNNVPLDHKQWKEKECGLVLSGHLWGEVLHDNIKNGCGAD